MLDGGERLDPNLLGQMQDSVNRSRLATEAQGAGRNGVF